MSRLRTVKWASLGIGALSLLLVLGFFYLDIRNSSPGEIAWVHAQEPALADSRNCVACHGGASSQSMTAACLACHADIGEQLATRTGVHGTLPDDPQDCERCHSEHHGRDFELVSTRSFSLAGISEWKSYDHSGFDFRLSGKHQQIACSRCHRFADAKRLSKGTRRFLGLDQRCTSCHDDVHKDSYGPDCAACHGQERPFSHVANFQHTAAFALIGSHGKRACVECHEPGSEHSVAGLLSAESQGGRVPAIRDCQACHASPHSETFLTSVARQLNLDVNGSCQHCHDAKHETFRGPQATTDATLHALTGFALNRPHDAVSCERCHHQFGQKKSPHVGFLECYPGRRAEDCRACHGDPHRGEFQDGPWRGSDCLSCHEKDRFRPAAFGLAHHDRTQFPLVGAHRRVGCSKCHTPSSPPSVVSSAPRQTRGTNANGPLGVTPGHSAALVFRGAPTQCRACHVDPHAGQFRDATFVDADCLACHSQDSFAPASFTIQQHDHTKFPLTGAHRAVSCNGCHIESTRQTNAARANIASRVFHGTGTSCQSCHRDVHDGAFNAPNLPTLVAGASGCARCHTTERFDQLRAENFDHRLWTGYPLEAAHGRAECADCHQRKKVPDDRGRTLGRVAGANCRACHVDPHAGQFGTGSRVDCSRCHVVGDTFRELVFDHQVHSAFQLDDVHAKLDCSKCHTRYRLADGASVVRYKPLGKQCADCHDPGGRSGKVKRKS